MVHADGAPTGGPGGGTDFEGYTLEQLQAMIAGANPSALGVYADKLHGTAQRIQTATDGLTKCIQALSGAWEGPAAESFRTWAGGVTAAAAGLGDYVSAAGTHVNHVGQQIFVAKMRMPQVPPTVLATANQGPVAVVSAATNPPPGGADPIKAHQEAKAQVDAAHQEAVTQMRTLASTYRVAAADLKALPAPEFPPPPTNFDPSYEQTSAIDGPGGSRSSNAGPSGAVPGSGTTGRPKQAPMSSGASKPGIYSAPFGSVPGSVSPTGTEGGVAPYIPQSTNLQGNGPLTASDPTNATWVPPTSGGGSSSNSHVLTSTALFPDGNPVNPAGGGRISGFPGTIARSSEGPNVNPGSAPRGGSSGGAVTRSGGTPTGIPGGSTVPGSTPRGPSVPGGRGSFSASPGGPGISSPAQAATPGTSSSARMPGIPGAAGASSLPPRERGGAPSRRLANSRGGSIGNASGSPSNRNSPRLQALAAESESSGTATPQHPTGQPGQRTPFTGGARSEQVRRRTPRSEEADDNPWDGPRQPGVVPPVID
ncbi:hypothetical protein EHYA_04051 [Embleya hyalina]|uniref:PPE family domain-containing protein n=1 Tax=Embleya hyalina TaxID=516124 RepID=A0A401YP68_9ACTN|nr:hypothetical protein EHYA_04051 [Embleya hyalina]